MCNLLETGFIYLLKEESKENVLIENLKNAYDDFIKQLEIICSDNDNITIYRKLNNTRAELVFIESFYRYGQGKKCLEICLS